MEDAFSAIPFLLELPVPPGKGDEIYPARMSTESHKPGSPGTEDGGLGALAAAAIAASAGEVKAIAEQMLCTPLCSRTRLQCAP